MSQPSSSSVRFRVLYVRTPAVYMAHTDGRQLVCTVRIPSFTRLAQSKIEELAIGLAIEAWEFAFGNGRPQLQIPFESHNALLAYFQRFEPGPHLSVPSDVDMGTRQHITRKVISIYMGTQSA